MEFNFEMGIREKKHVCSRFFFNGIRGIKDIELFPIEEFKIDLLLLNFSEYHLRAICTDQGIGKLNEYKKELNI